MRRRKRNCLRMDIEHCIERTKLLLIKIPHCRIVNCDETMWGVVPNGMITWAPVGEDNVSVEVDADTKAGIPVVARVAAHSENFHLFSSQPSRNASLPPFCFSHESQPPSIHTPPWPDNHKIRLRRYNRSPDRSAAIHCDGTRSVQRARASSAVCSWGAVRIPDGINARRDELCHARRNRDPEQINELINESTNELRSKKASASHGCE
jgi:hypothetical protein